MFDSPSVLFVGVGSPHGDDRIGWHIAEILSRELGDQDQITVRKAAVPMDILDWLDDCDELHVCDAAESQEPIGSVRRIESTFGQPPPADWLGCIQQLHGSSSHDFSLAATLQLATQLSRLPPRVVVHAVSASRLREGSLISAALQRRVQEIASMILGELTNA